MSSPTSENTAASSLAAQVLAELRVTDDAERNLTQLYNATHAESLEALGTVLLALLNQGEVVLLYRVHGPDGEGLEDFEDPQRIPPEMPDPSREPESTFRVGLQDVEVIYRAAGKDFRAHSETRR